MKNRFHVVIGISFFVAISLIFSFCHNSLSPDNTPTNNGPTCIVAGKVFSTTNGVLPNVQVSIGDLIAYTDSKGEFYFPKVPASQRSLINFSLAGYSKTQKIAEVSSNKTSYVEAALATAIIQNFNIPTGKTMMLSGARVEIPASSIVDSKGKTFTGNAQISFAYFDPTITQFTHAFPGDFVGIQSNGVPGSIESFGYISVEIYNGAEKLQLAPGQTANITLPIPQSKLATAPQTISLWFYDDSKGNWMEDGAAVKTGDAYAGTVKHFSHWSCDNVFQTSFLQGNVIDPRGAPLSFVTVNALGSNYTGASHTMTNDSGAFTLTVKAGASVTVWASYFTFTSTGNAISAPTAGQVKDAGVITLPVDTSGICIITGRLLDNGMQPISGRLIQRKDKSGNLLDWINSNVDGKFNFACIPGATYTLEIGSGVDSLHAVHTLSATPPSSATTFDVGDIKLDFGGSTVTGRVVDATNTPLSNVSVFCMEASGDQNAAAQTDATGRFTLHVRPNTSFDIQFKYNGKTKSVTVTGGASGGTKDIGDFQIP